MGHTDATFRTDDRAMGKQIAVIILIFLVTTCGWMILGTSVAMRSNSADSGLSKGVQSNWGSAQQQTPPSGVATHVPAALVPKPTKHEARRAPVNERPRVACCPKLGASQAAAI